MSLLEDVVNVLRMVLEYFGVPPEMLVPVWDSQLCGQYRSIVRMIGSNLPLTPPPRVHFQIPLVTYRPNGYIDVAVDTPAIPSLADVMWVFEDEGDTSAKTRNHLPPNRLTNAHQDMARHPGLSLNKAQKGVRSARKTPDPEALKKITALESELLKLQAQIAMIVTAAPSSGLTQCPTTLSPPPPALTSTPRRPTSGPPPPPPPPPPPLPLPPVPPCPSSSSNTVLELIQKRRNNPDKDRLKPRDSGPHRGAEVKGIPSMLDVLKDLNQVKLRSVKRSPGGTPVRKRRSKGGPASLHDPAALIAEALKRKFAQHHLNNSSDKENSLDSSPFGSPEATPKAPHLVRRSQGRLHM